MEEATEAGLNDDEKLDTEPEPETRAGELKPVMLG